MTVEKRDAPAEETPDDGSAAGAQDDEDENEVEAHGGWGGVGKPDS